MNRFINYLTMFRSKKVIIQEGIKWDEETKKKIEECLVFENDNVRVFNSPDGVFCSAAYYSEKQGKLYAS